VTATQGTTRSKGAATQWGAAAAAAVWPQHDGLQHDLTQRAATRCSTACNKYVTSWHQQRRGGVMGNNRDDGTTGSTTTVATRHSSDNDTTGSSSLPTRQATARSRR